MNCSLRHPSWLATLALWLGCAGAAEPAVGSAPQALEIGGECLISDETIEHACLHANLGPFASVTAQSYPGSVFTDVNTPHTAYTVELPPAGTGFSGAVLYQPNIDGEFGLLLDPAVQVELYASDGALLTPVGTAPGDPSLCAQISQIAVYALSSAETYTLVLSSEVTSDPLLLLEYLGVEASCGDSCEPITLVASRSYLPPTFSDAEVVLDHHIMFEIPSHIQVTEGSAGFYLATLTYAHEGEQVVCRYRGNGRRRYVFERCSNGACAGAEAEADYLKLRVHRGGNAGPNQQTTVELTIQPECEGEHEHEGEGE